MKTLYESLLDDEDEVMDKMGNDLTAEYVEKIESFFRCFCDGIKPGKIDTNSYPVVVDIAPMTSPYMTIYRDIPEFMRIGKCKGNLEVGKEVTTLKGFPKNIDGSFSCCGNNYITSLKDGPKKVKGDYGCTSLPNLTSLEGCPKKCKDFSCANNPGLKNLVGGPQEVERDYNCCMCMNLLSLKGCAKKIGWNLDLSDCIQLTDIKDIPKNLPGNLYIPRGGKLKPDDFKEYCNVGNEIHFK